MNNNFPHPYSDLYAGLENGKKHLNVNFFSAKSLSREIKKLRVDVEDKTNFLTIYENNLTSYGNNKFRNSGKIPNTKYMTTKKTNSKNQTTNTDFKLMTELPSKTKYHSKMPHSPDILIQDANINSPTSLFLEQDRDIDKLVSKQQLELIFKKHKPAEVRTSTKTTNIHSNFTDYSHNIEELTEPLPNLKTQRNLKMECISPVKQMKSTGTSFFSAGRNHSNIQLNHSKQSSTDQLDPKKQKEIEFLYDKIFSTKKRLYKEPRTVNGYKKNCHVLYQGPEKVFVPIKSYYIKDKIKEIYKKISFMKGVFDYTYPQIMVEKMRQNKKEYDEFIERFNDNIYEKNKKLEKKLKTQNNYNLSKIADPNLPSEKEFRNTKTDFVYLNTKNNYNLQMTPRNIEEMYEVTKNSSKK